MDRRRSPVVEGLEGRALLSSLQYSLTTDQPVYPIGQQVSLTFSETNTSDQPVTVAVSPTDFTISHNNAVVWQSDPFNNGQPPTSQTLLPGQSVTQSATWAGSGGVLTPGAGSVHGTPVSLWGTFVFSNPNAPAGLTGTFQITDPITSSVTTDQQVYTLGQPIQMTYTQVNTSDQWVSLAAQPPAGFTITHDGKAVLLDSLPQSVSNTPVTFQPGQAMTDSQTWNGIPISGPFTLGSLTGTFVIGYGPASDPTQSTATIQIAPPSPDDLVTKVATDQLVYDTGEPVKLTFTETNDGNQPIAVVTGSPEFEVTKNGTSVWALPNPDAQPATWTTLQPGQSYTQTATWNGSGGGTGTFAVADPFDSSGSSALFQIVSTPYTGGSGPSTSNTGPSPIVATLSTSRAVFKLGQRIPLSLKLKDVSTSRVAIRSSQGTATVSIQTGSTVVYVSARKLHPLGPLTIKAGHTLRLKTAWAGNANQAGINNLSPGTYTITVDEDGYDASATVQLVARHERARVDG